ncbi:hypothetical protein SAMN04488590_0262 [Microbacterium sp. 77mftsu3.1]|nr:hypothetical protein SAMN04488590_0262 [Microbacterium sp. 77mftsu3.1]
MTRNDQTLAIVTGILCVITLVFAAVGIAVMS